MEEDLLCEVAKPRSRCLYCGSVSYGKGCRYGPAGVHFHAEDPLKCSYCGSKDYGKGCHMNPFDKIHLHGIPYNSMISEEIDGFLKSWTILEALKKDITCYPAFHAGLIDENGSILREPINTAERMMLNEEIKTILKIKKFLGSKLDIISHTPLLGGSQNISESFNTQEKLQKLLHLEDKINGVYNDFCSVIEECHREGLSLDTIRTLISKQSGL